MSSASYKNPSGNLRVKLHFLGANSNVVTGSATIMEITRNNITRKILVDYGCFQGENEHLNRERFIVGDDIDCVLLTHAHLDHCGGIPNLFRPYDDIVPYTGKVYGSRETLNQAKFILYNSAKINSCNVVSIRSTIDKSYDDLQRLKERKERENAKISEISSILSAIDIIKEEIDVYYDTDDVDEAIKHFAPIDITDNDGVEVSLFEGIDAKFIPVPHINGACMIEVKASLGDESYTVVFTGDIGKEETLLYKKMNYPMNLNANAIVMESLHGEAPEIEDLETSIFKLYRLLKRAEKKRKMVIIPTFAMDRSAGIIKVLNDFMDGGLYLKNYIDSPLAISELLEYISSYQTFESAWFDYSSTYPFKVDRFKIINNYQDHMHYIKKEGFNVFITASCMGYGGRVLDYFEHCVQDDDCIFIFPGYLPFDSPSRKLLEANKGTIVELNGKRYVKHCETYQLHGFSSHGYIEDKVKILNTYPNATKVFLNHGDELSIIGTQDELEGYNYESEQVRREFIPTKYDEVVTLY